MTEKKKTRALLRSAALTAGSMLVGCGSAAGGEEEPLPLPGNPKGVVYDDEQGGETPPEQTENTESAENAENGENEGTEAESAESGETDTEETPPEGEGEGSMAPGMEPRPDMAPDIRPLPANPKGSLYDMRLYDPDFDPLAES